MILFKRRYTRIRITAICEQKSIFAKVVLSRWMRILGEKNEFMALEVEEHKVSKLYSD